MMFKGFGMVVGIGLIGLTCCGCNVDVKHKDADAIVLSPMLYAGDEKHDREFKEKERENKYSINKKESLSLLDAPAIGLFGGMLLIFNGIDYIGSVMEAITNPHAIKERVEKKKGFESRAFDLVGRIKREEMVVLKKENCGSIYDILYCNNGFRADDKQINDSYELSRAVESQEGTIVRVYGSPGICKMDIETVKNKRRAFLGLSRPIQDWI
jgi:hypothetical protein